MLRKYAFKCNHITELGTDIGFSTTAFLSTCPEELHCYDIVRQPFVDELERLAPSETVFRFHLENSLQCDIDYTDLLFIDTIHTYAQVKAELLLHGNKCRKYIVLHDIVSCPDIVNAIGEYMNARPHWMLREWCVKQCGLAVYERSPYG